MFQRTRWFETTAWFIFAIVACVVAAFASLLRGGKYVHTEVVAVDPLDIEAAA